MSKFLDYIIESPTEVKYLIFLGALLADAGTTGFVGYGTGLLGTAINAIVNYGLNIPEFYITTWQLLIIFVFLPLLYYLLTHGKQNVNV